MFLYFFILDQIFFQRLMTPALTLSYRLRSFAPCVELCRAVLACNHQVPPDALVRAVVAGLPFDRTFWHALVGECLVHGAQDIPRLPTAPDIFCSLLAPDWTASADFTRSNWPPVRQAHFGSRDVQFGRGTYRPEHAGLNDPKDVARLAEYLERVDPTIWTPDDLALLPVADDQQRVEELADARDWWPHLVELYQSARDNNRVIICEDV